MPEPVVGRSRDVLRRRREDEAVLDTTNNDLPRVEALSRIQEWKSQLADGE